MKDELIYLFLNEIKSKNQIADLENEFIKNRLNQFFLKNGDIRKKIELEFEKKQEKIIKSKKFKEIIKSIRKEIGIIYGSFLTSDFNKKNKKLQNIDIKKLLELNIKDNNEEIKILLELHKSTRERCENYDEVYSEIFSWYKPNKIGDIACGLNPISLIFMKKYLKKLPDYFASDLNPSDMNFLNLFFENFKNIINAKAKAYNVVDLSILDDSDFQECDLVFLFKAIDSFETIKKNISKDLLLGIKAKKIVVSFPKKSLVSKKEFKDEKRNWFFNFIENQPWNYKRFDLENEMFILIEK